MTRSPAGVMTPISLAEQILRAYSTGPNPDHGGTLGFLGGPEKRIGYEFMVDLTELRRAAIHVRAHYDQYIGNLAIPKVCSILHDYVILLFDRGLDTNLSIFLAQRRPARLVQYLSASALVTANILLGEIIEHKSDKSITIFPCRNIAIDIDLIAGNFAILSHNSDLSIITAFHKNNHQLLPGKFPPIHWDGSTHRLSCHDSIAGVITHCPDFPIDEVQILAGAIMFAIDGSPARLHCMAPGIPGQARFTESGKVSMSDIAPIIPSLMEPATLGPKSVDFLRRILSKAASESRTRNALQFAYLGWAPRGLVGFIHNAVALDALFGTERQTSQAIIAGIVRTATTVSDVGIRADLLCRIRNTILHGRSSSIFSCPQYTEYIERFDCTPEDDQFRILRECLWSMA